MKILIVKLGAVGDVVHTLPSLRSLRKAFPDAFIAWVVEEKSKDVIIGNPDLDEVIVFERKKIQRGFKSLKDIGSSIRDISDFLKRLRGHSFDIAIDFQTLFKSGLITYLSGAPKRIGFDKWRELNRLFTNKRVKSVKEHVVDKYLDLVEATGVSIDPTPVKIVYSSEDAAYIDDFLAKVGLAKKHENPPAPQSPPVKGGEVFNIPSPLVGEGQGEGGKKRWVALNPGASWPSKLWGGDRYAAVCDKLADAGIPVVIIWGPGEEGLVDGILESVKVRPIVAPKTSIKQLACLLESAGLYVGGDTGPLHMAVAMGTQVVGIYGPSDPKRNGPYGEGHRVLQADIECASCWNRVCSKMECMERVSVDDVAKAVITKIHTTEARKDGDTEKK